MVGGISPAPAVKIEAFGVGSTQNAADAAALANLNYQRSNRYGFDSAAVSTDPKAITPNTVGGSSGPGSAAGATTRHTKDST